MTLRKQRIQSKAEDLREGSGSGAQPASLPLHEPERLRALYDSGLLDSAASPVFTQLTHVVADIFRVPIVLISLVDKDRQYFYCAFGLTVCQTHRDESFCAYAVLRPAPFVVLDTHRDPRFCSNPLVTGEPYLRFYAGAPIYSADQQCLGTLCVLDNKPWRSFGRPRRRMLTGLADVVSAMIAADAHNAGEGAQRTAASQPVAVDPAVRVSGLSNSRKPSSV